MSDYVICLFCAKQPPNKSCYKKHKSWITTYNEENVKPIEKQVKKKKNLKKK